jgi:hypothetical protein
MEQMAVVNQKGGIRVVAPNKCGHTSVINMFRTRRDKEPESVKLHKHCRDDFSEWPAAKYTLIFFRDPLARAVSAYEHFIARTLRINARRKSGYSNFAHYGFTPEMKFLEYVKHLATIDISCDPHLLPQSDSLLRSGSGELIVGQLERFAEQWPLLVDYLGLDCSKQIEHINKAKYDRSGADYRGFDEAAALIREVYAIDFDEYWSYLDEAGTPLQAIDHTTLEGAVRLAD